MTVGELKAVLTRLKEACKEIRDRESEEEDDMDDPNCYGAGWCSGAIATANELESCIDEELEKIP